MSPQVALYSWQRGSAALLHRDGTGEQNVVFQMNVLVEISLEFSECPVERLIADACVRRSGIAAAGLTHGTQSVTGRVMLVHHHRNRVLYGAEGRRQDRLPFDDRFFHAYDVG